MPQPSLRRAAVLIQSLPPAAAARILSSMPADQRQAVRQEIRRLGPIDEQERKRVIASFMKSTDNSAAPAATVAATTETPASPTPRPIDSFGPGFEFLQDVDDEVLQAAIKDEPSTAVAVVFANIPPAQAARLLKQFDEVQRMQVVQRLSQIDQVTPDALADIRDHFKQLIETTSRKFHAAGRKTLQAIAAHLDGPELALLQRAVPSVKPKAQDSTLSSPQPENRLEAMMGMPAGAYDSEAVGMEAAHVLKFPADRVAKQNRWSFDELQRLPATTIRRLLAEVDSETAVLALLGMRVDVAEAVLATLPKKQAKIVRRELASLGPLLLRDIDQAQNALETVADKLLQQGAIAEAPRALAAA